MPQPLPPLALLIRTDGTTEKVTPARGRKFKLPELQAFVGGYIECLEVGVNLDMIVNEEGLILKLPANAFASQLTGRYIVGNVLLVRRGQW